MVCPETALIVIGLVFALPLISCMNMNLPPGTEVVNVIAIGPPLVSTTSRPSVKPIVKSELLGTI